MKQTPSFSAIIHPASPRWSARLQVAPSVLPRFWRSWLLDNGSLTARLSALAPGQFSVECVNEGVGQPTPTEQRELQLSLSDRIWYREVILKLRDTPVVYARTAVPEKALKNRLARLRHLGNRSLGSFLFSQPDLRRAPIYVSHCKDNPAALKWARRSVFTVGSSSLMVSEAFSPDLTAFT